MSLPLLVRDFLAGKPLVRRSGRWPKVRAAWLKDHPTCEACGGTAHLNVHHRIPVHVQPELELRSDNLMTLCERPTWNCHLWVGHDGNWRQYRQHVDTAAGMIHEGLQET